MIELPVLPDTNGEAILLESYLAERNNLMSANDLPAFVKRWKTLFVLSLEKTSEESKVYLQQLIDNTFDVEDTWLYMQEGPFDQLNAGIHILLPPSLLFAYLCAVEYGVSLDIAFIQMFRLRELF